MKEEATTPSFNLTEKSYKKGLVIREKQKGAYIAFNGAQDFVDYTHLFRVLKESSLGNFGNLIEVCSFTNYIILADVRENTDFYKQVNMKRSM